MILKTLSISIVALTVILVSCKENTDDQKNKETSDAVSISIVRTDSLDTNSNNVSYSLPSALQIAYVFKKSGAGFVPNLLNGKANISKYNTTNFKRATNFGVYSADLAYCIFNKKYQEAKEQLKACKEVGTYLGLNQAFESDNMAQRFDKNISNEDSVVKIVSTVQLKTDIMFEQNSQKHITVIAFSGAWIESMHIAFEIYAKDKNKKVLSSLLEQLLLSETVIKALKLNENAEPEISTFISELEAINKQFNEIADIKKNMINEEIDFNSIAVTDAEFAGIAKSVATLRSSIVN